MPFTREEEQIEADRRVAKAVGWGVAIGFVLGFLSALIVFAIVGTYV